MKFAILFLSSILAGNLLAQSKPTADLIITNAKVWTVDKANPTAEAVAVLTGTPATLDALLRGLPDAWVRSNEGKDTWSAFDIVGHLIFGERTD